MTGKTMLRRVTAFAVCLALLLGFTPFSPKAAAAGSLSGELDDSNITLECSGDAVWTAEGNTITGQVQGTRGMMGLGAMSKSGSLTITVRTDSAVSLSFSVSAVPNGGIVTVDGQEYYSEDPSAFVKEDMANGDSIQIDLTSDRSDRVTTVELKDIRLAAPTAKPKVTFKAPENGSYTVDGAEITEDTVKSDRAEYVLSASPGDGYRFAGWVDGDNTAISEDADYTLSPDEDITVSPLFIAFDAALFGVGDALFGELDKAVSRAESGEDKVVTVLRSGRADGDFTIPNGVILLVPCDGEGTVCTDEPKAAPEYREASEYRLLTLNGRLTVESGGAVCVMSEYSPDGASGTCIGAPTGPFGRIDLTFESGIDLKSGAKLYAYGYITGEGTVTAEAGSTVHELFQVADYRSGIDVERMQAAAVFPFTRYYVRNIRASLRLYDGAVETVHTAVTADGSAFRLVGEDGLFCVENGYIEKKYDTDWDITKLDFYGDASMNGITLELDGVPLDSGACVFPITESLSMSVKRGTLTLTHDVCLLPGAELAVESRAGLRVLSALYAYGLEDSGFADGEPAAEPYYFEYDHRRTEDEIGDAKIDVSGTLTVEGGLYATAGNRAGVTSSAFAGKIRISRAAVGAAPGELRAYRDGSTLERVPVVFAKLRNLDGSYTDTADGPADSLYTYLAGTWIRQQHFELPKEKQIFTYDGSGHGFDIGFENELAEYPEISYGKEGTWSADPPTQAGEYDVQVIRVEDAFYTKIDTTLKGALVINPREVGIQWQDPEDLTYNGEPKSVTVGLTGTIDGAEVSPTLSGEPAAADAGQHHVEVSGLSGADAGNYVIAEDAERTHDWSILRAKADIVWPTAPEVTYSPGLTLGSVPLEGGSTGFGSFEWAEPETVLDAGTSDRAVRFVPDPKLDPKNYDGLEETERNVSLTVRKADRSAPVVRDSGTPGDVGDITVLQPSAAGEPGRITGLTTDMEWSDGTGAWLWTPVTEDEARDGMAAAQGETRYFRYGENVNYNVSPVSDAVRIDRLWTVVYRDGDGRSVPPSVTVKDGTSVRVEDAPEYEGHTFAGWEISPGGGLCRPGTEITVDRDITLTAGWDVESYDVTFDTQGAETESFTKRAEYGSAIEQPEDPVRTGYDFSGWYTDAGCGEDSRWDFGSGRVTGPMTLYAGWTAGIFRITFVTGTEDVSVPEKVLRFGEKTVKPEDPRREGYSFDGWYRSPEEGGERYEFGGSMPAEDITLYAHWTPNTYRLTLLPGEGASLADIGRWTEREVTFGERLCEGELPEPSREGHIFGGWFDGEGIEFFGESPMPAHDLTLTAKWTPEKYEVHFNLGYEGGSGLPTRTAEYGTLLAKPEGVSRTGFRLLGWFGEDGTEWDFERDTVSRSMTLTAHWVAVEYAVTFRYQDGRTSDRTEKVKFGEHIREPERPERTGYDFSGWYAGEDSGARWDFERDTMPAENITLYAHWTRGEYGITFDSRGGGTVMGQRHAFGESVGTLPVPVRTGYTFDGWFISDGGEEKRFEDGSPMPAADITLYAKWTPNSYTLTLDTGGGSISGDAEQWRDGCAELPFGTPIRAEDLPEPSRRGYTFAGWYTDPSCETELPDGMTMPAGQLTLYAKWAAVRYRITFEYDDGATPDRVETADFGSVVAAPAPNARTGYDFAGWRGGDGAVYPAGYEITVDGEMRFTAVWQVHTHTVTFVSEGRETEKRERVEYGSVFGGPETLPERAGYSLAGWSTEDGGAGALWDFDTGRMPDGDITLYAVWTPNSYTLTLEPGEGAAMSGERVRTEKFGATLVLPEPAMEGYGFAGWFDDAAGVRYESGVSTMPASDLVLTAHWEANDCTVVFMNGDSEFARETVKFGSPVHCPSPAPERTGYTFDGWYAAPDCSESGRWSFDGAVSGSMTLYAGWTAERYTLTYELGEGAEDPGNPSSYTVESGDLTLAAPEREGYTFLGWRLDGAGEILPHPHTIPSGSYGDRNFTAVWSRNRHTVRWLSAEGDTFEEAEYGFGESVRKPEGGPFRDGYRFDGWEEYPEKMPDEDVEVLAEWTSYLELLTGVPDFEGENLAAAREYYGRLNVEQAMLYDAEELFRAIVGGALPRARELLRLNGGTAELSIGEKDGRHIVTVDITAPGASADALFDIPFLECLFGCAELQKFEINGAECSLERSDTAEEMLWAVLGEKLGIASKDEFGKWLEENHGTLTAGVLAGTSAEVTLYGSPRASSGYMPKKAASFTVRFAARREPTPNAVIDFFAERVAGLVPGAEYAVNGTAVTADADGGFGIAESMFGTELAITAGATASSLESEAQKLYIPARPDAPEVSARMATGEGAADGGITGLDADAGYEYRAEGSESWTEADAGTGEISGLLPGRYEVRTAASEGAFRSKTALVTVEARTLVAIEVAGGPDRTTYVEGERFDPSGLVLGLRYNDGAEERVAYGAENAEMFIFSPDVLTLGTEAVTVGYGGLRCTVEVTVEARTLVSIDVADGPDRTAYVEGERFDPSGLVLGLRYNDGTEERVAYGSENAEMFIFSPKVLTLGTETVTVEYGGLSCTVEVTVEAKTYTITFETGVEGLYVAPIVAAPGTPIHAPDAPTRDGYVFVGWMLDGVPYVFDTMPAKDILLTAEWSPVPLPPHTHVWTVTEEREPTCVRSGSREYVCRDCGEVMTEYLPARGHVDGAFAAVRPASCTESGFEERVCPVCGEVTGFREVLPVGHDYVNLGVVGRGCGGSVLEMYECSACGDRYILAVGGASAHTPVRDAAVEPSCTRNGLTEGSHCSVCGAVTVPQRTVPGGHRYEEHRVEADCTEDAAVIGICSVCGDSFTAVEENSALGHSFEYADTITENGITTVLYRCSVCGSTRTETTVDCGTADGGITVSDPDGGIAVTLDGKTVKDLGERADGEIRISIGTIDSTARMRESFDAGMCGALEAYVRGDASLVLRVCISDGAGHELLAGDMTAAGSITVSVPYAARYPESVLRVFRVDGNGAFWDCGGCEYDGASVTFETDRLSVFVIWEECLHPEVICETVLEASTDAEGLERVFCADCGAGGYRTVPASGEADAPREKDFPGFLHIPTGKRRDMRDPRVNGAARLLETDKHIAFMSADDDGLFRPNDGMTRAEAAQVFYSLLRDRNTAGNARFDDVPEDAWYSRAVTALADLGIVMGSGDGSFRPNDMITRAEFAAMAARFVCGAAWDCRFTDVNRGMWAYVSIGTAVHCGWFAGYEDGSFRPDSAITRAEAAAVVNRILMRSADREYVDGFVTPGFADVDPSGWAYYDIVEATVDHGFTRRADGGEIWGG